MVCHGSTPINQQKIHNIPDPSGRTAHTGLTVAKGKQFRCQIPELAYHGEAAR